MSDNINIVVRDKIANGIAGKLRDIGNAADFAYQRISKLQRLLNRSLGARFVNATGINRFNQAVNGATNSVNRLNTASSSTKLSFFSQQLLRGAQNASRLERSVYRVSQGLRSLLSGALLLGASAGIVDKIDQFTNIQNRLRQVSQVTGSDGTFDAEASQRRLTELTKQIFDLANRARTPVAELSTTFQRLDFAMQAVGKSQTETLRITETISKALSLNGANATEASQSMRQLSQAFGKGKLDGDEFRTTAENIPAVLVALEAALGANRKELFEFSKNGKISIDVMIEAFEEFAKKVDEDFARTPRTLGQAFTQLSNQVTLLFGQLDRRVGITSGLIGFVDYLKNNLPQVTRLMYAFGVSIGTLLAIQLASKLGSILGFFTSLPTVLAIAAGYFAYFSDEIIVTEGNLANLSDSLQGFIQSLSSVEGRSIFGEFFTTQGAEANLRLILSLVDKLVLSYYELKAGLKAFGDIMKEAVFNVELDNIFSNLLIKGAQSAVLEITALLIEAVEPVAEAMTKALLLGVQELTKKAISFGGGRLPFGIGDFLKSLNDGFKQFDPVKSDFFDFTKVADKVREFKISYEGELKQINEILDRIALENKALLDQDVNNYNDYKNRITQISEEIAQARIKQAEDIAALQQSGLSDLRGPGENLSGGTAALDISFQDRQSILNSPLQSGALAQFSDFDIETIRQVRNETVQLKQELQTLPQATQAGTQATQQAIQGVGTAATASQTAVQTVEQASQSAGQAIGQSISQGSQTASQAIGSLATSAVARLEEITQAAIRAAEAVSNIGVGSSAISPITPGQGFATGGYTGNLPTNRVAGVVHGQEYVMPANITKQYRPLFDAMLSGNVTPSSQYNQSGGGVSVYVENNTNSRIDVEQIGPNEVRIIASQVVRKDSDSIIAAAIKNPNSKTSKSLSQNLKTGRSR